jgi:thiosulfate/3-mercaptopyruvate sulfurtransferase
MTTDLISAEWLQEHLKDTTLKIIDCRWVLGQLGEGKKQYDAGHIPGAIHLDIDVQLSGKEGAEGIGGGRHPIPNKRDFQKLMSEIGIGREGHVILYDEGNGMPAARLWWLLRYFGHEKISILDGGWKLWTAEGRAQDQEVTQLRPAEFVARAKLKMVLNKEGVDSLREEPNVLLIDARAPERYRGEVEPIDAKAGHIPGSENFPFTQTLDPATGKFLSPEKLKAEFIKLGADKEKTIISYCGSGVTACTNILALKLAGFDSKLYEGSWSEWSKDTDLPVATK